MLMAATNSGASAASSSCSTRSVIEASEYQTPSRTPCPRNAFSVRKRWMPMARKVSVRFQNAPELPCTATVA